MSRLWFLILIASFSCLAQADFLDRRLGEISAQTEMTAEFTDIWRAEYLDEDVVSHGKLYFKSPDLLIKEVISPEPATYTVSGESVKVEQGETVKHIQLSDHPELGMGIYALRMLLQGNRKGLDRMFLYQFRHSDNSFESWVIELFPKSTYSKEKVRKIEVAGEKGELREVKVIYTSADVYITRIKANE
ncbi:LolA family protein [Thiohalophilus thiocyanatoxydans]|uniref:Outer membrane lipoprotein-sorting protein n=1 Tax=Thiohalophilus thiocyanatoxydans TaxID=381308 RepID=A0A4R8IYK2_9GAMM|nr:LolA-related protein [Thiohalophilus thiocyanatoxydans]TDY02919.1 hypothetical protein EDC23_1303 [Thiohalophilus thiocyanatoxydans]